MFSLSTLLSVKPIALIVFLYNWRFGSLPGPISHITLLFLVKFVAMQICNVYIFFLTVGDSKVFLSPKTKSTRSTTIHVFLPFKATWMAKVIRTQVMEVTVVTLLPLHPEALVNIYLHLHFIIPYIIFKKKYLKVDNKKN